MITTVEETVESVILQISNPSQMRFSIKVPSAQYSGAYRRRKRDGLDRDQQKTKEKLVHNGECEEKEGEEGGLLRCSR